MRKMHHTAKKNKTQTKCSLQRAIFLFCKHMVFDGHSVSMLLSLIMMCHNKVSTSLLMVTEVH